MIATLLVLSVIFVGTNQDFFDKSAEQINKGYEWHFTGVKNPSSDTKHISIWIPGKGKENDLILFQLRKPEK